MAEGVAASAVEISIGALHPLYTLLLSEAIKNALDKDRFQIALTVLPRSRFRSFTVILFLHAYRQGSFSLTKKPIFWSIIFI